MPERPGQWVALQLAGFQPWPVSHYMALGLARDASTEAIHNACEAGIQRYAAASTWARAGMALLGRHPSRLAEACRELSAPAARRRYDEYLEQMEHVLFSRPY